VTTPAPNLRGRYHSALSSRRWSGDRHSSEATIFEDKIAEDSLGRANQDTNTNRSPQERPSPKMWPFADSEGNPRIEPLVPAEDTPLANSDVNPPMEPLIPAGDTPVANSELTPPIEPLVPAEEMPIAAVEAERRNSTPEIEQQENSGTSLRPSKSLSSLQLTLQRRGLYIPPGTALSQSSEVYAQGEVTLPPRQADIQEQPSSEQAVQEQEHVPGPGQEPAIINDGKYIPNAREDNATNASGPDQKLVSVDNDQQEAQAPSPAQDDWQQSSTSAQRGDQTLEPTTVLDPHEPQSARSDPAAENAKSAKPATDDDKGAQTIEPTADLESKEQQSPASDPAAENPQAAEPATVVHDDKGAQTLEPTTILESKEQQSPASDAAAENAKATAPESVLNVGGGAPADQPSRSGASQPDLLRSRNVGNTDLGESSASDQAPRKSSITSPIPTIRVQPTTESDEMAPSSEEFDENNFQSTPHKARRQSFEGSAGQSHDSHMSNPASGVSPSQVDAASPTAAVPETPSGLNSSVGIVKDGAGVAYPGFTKLAIRKARNVAANKLVLSIFLGRELAEPTKRQLQELARSPLWRVGKTVPAPGLSQMDGIAELEGELGFST
jgi:hypothetical protein